MFVPVDFVVPLRLEAPEFRVEPLGPQHNDSDYDAWSSSIEHIRSSPGWAESSWPREMTLEENRADLVRHARDFENRSGFTYTVLDPEGEVVGCVYIYPAAPGSQTAGVSSWVRESRAELDEPLWRAVSGWLATDWPFEEVQYATRGS